MASELRAYEIGTGVAEPYHYKDAQQKRYALTGVVDERHQGYRQCDVDLRSERADERSYGTAAFRIERCHKPGDDIYQIQTAPRRQKGEARPRSEAEDDRIESVDEHKRAGYVEQMHREARSPLMPVDKMEELIDGKSRQQAAQRSEERGVDDNAAHYDSNVKGAREAS